MKQSILQAYWLVIFIIFGSCVSNEKPEKLFTEENDSWQQSGESTWKFDGGELIALADSTSGFVITKSTYKNFELMVDFYPDSTINSGVFVRCKNQKMGAVDCFEINIWDLHPNQEYRTGAIVQRASPKEKLNTIGKWNTYRIRCKGANVKVWLNGIITADIQNNDLLEGHVGLQAAGKGEIRFRNVSIHSITYN